MSRFQISTTRYSACAPDPDDTRLFDTDLAEAEERHMVYTVEETIRHGEMFRHEYDYGDTTHLDLECVAILPAPYHCLPGLIDPPEPAEGHTDDFITIVARNLPPEHCFTCGETARWRYHENPYTLVPPADGGPSVAPPYFCDECAPRDVVLAVLRNSPHNGTGCYDKVHHQP